MLIRGPLESVADLVEIHGDIVVISCPEPTAEDEAYARELIARGALG